MESHSIHLFVVVDIQCSYSNSIMSWTKQSAAAGLGGVGLIPREAARGAFQLDSFQNMGDPLADPDPTLGPLIKEVSVDFISFKFL